MVRYEGKHISKDVALGWKKSWMKNFRKLSLFYPKRSARNRRFRSSIMQFRDFPNEKKYSQRERAYSIHDFKWINRKPKNGIWHRVTRYDCHIAVSFGMFSFLRSYAYWSDLQILSQNLLFSTWQPLRGSCHILKTQSLWYMRGLFKFWKPTNQFCGAHQSLWVDYLQGAERLFCIWHNKSSPVSYLWRWQAC